MRLRLSLKMGIKYRLVKVKSYVLDKMAWDYNTFKFDRYKYHIQKKGMFGWYNYLDHMLDKEHGLIILNRLKLEDA